MGNTVHPGCMRSTFCIAHAVKFVFCASSTIMPSGQWFTGFFYVKGTCSLSEREWLRFMDIHGRQRFGRQSFPLFCCPDAGNGFEDKNILEKQVERMSMRNKKAGRSWQKQAAGYPFQDTAARKANAQYWKNCTTIRTVNFTHRARRGA